MLFRMIRGIKVSSDWFECVLNYCLKNRFGEIFQTEPPRLTGFFIRKETLS